MYQKTISVQSATVLTSSFLLKLLIFRCLMFAIGAWELDQSLSALVSCNGTYSFVERLVLLSMFTTLLLNTFGIVWPLLDIQSYEKRFKTFQRTVVSVTVLARLCQALFAQSWVPQRDIMQSLVFDAFMLIINQDPTEELLLQLAFVQLVYNIGNLFVAQPHTSSSASHLDATTQCEFFVMILMLVIPVHKLYCRVIGPRDKAGALQQRVGLLMSKGKSLGIASELRRWVANIVFWKEVQPKNGKHLTKAYVLKLVTVKAMHCTHFFMLFIGLASCAYQESGQGTSGADDPVCSASGLSVLGAAPEQSLSQSQSDIRIMALVSCFATIALGSHACIAAFGGRFFFKYLSQVNGTGLLLCGACRIALIILDCKIAGSGSGASNLVIFHNLLVVSFSLIAQEDSLGTFFLQLGGLTGLFKALAVFMDGAATPSAFLFSHHEYVILLGVMTLVYPATRVGKWTPDPDATVVPTPSFQPSKMMAGPSQKSCSSSIFRLRSSLDTYVARESMDMSVQLSCGGAPARPSTASEEHSPRVASHRVSSLMDQLPDCKTLKCGLSSSKNRLGVTVDLSSATAYARLLSKDRTLVLVELPLCTYLALQPMRVLLEIVGQLGMESACIACAVPALLYWLACAAHAVLLAYFPAVAMSRRNLLWGWRLDVALPLLQLSSLMLPLGDGQQLSPERGLVLLCTKWGLLDLGDKLFLKTLSIKVSVFILLDCYRQAFNVQLGQLLISILLFHLWAAIPYLAMRLAVWAAGKAAGKLQGKSITLKNSVVYSVVGPGLIAIAVVSQGLPSMVGLQVKAWTALTQGMRDLGFRFSFSSSLGSSALAVISIVVLFCCISLLQSAALHAANLLNPEQQWYQKQQIKVIEFMEMMSGSSDHSLDSIVAALKETTAAIFGEHMLVKLACIEGGSGNDSSLARLQVIHWGYKRKGEHLEDRTLPLLTLPSISHVTSRQSTVLTNDYDTSGAELDFEDWELQHHTHGIRSFLAMPLVFAGTSLGALILMSPKPNALHTQMQRIVADLGMQIAQSLYVWSCHHELAAGEQLITDMIPEHVAESLKRKMKRVEHSLRHKSKSSPSASGELLVKLSLPSTDGSLDIPPASSQQLGYQQWHPAVSILFADIVGFTTLSKEVEPELVMYMLHDLFSRFDAMCMARGIYKVETIGDCYMASTGLLVETDDHALQMVEFAKCMLEAAAAVPNPIGGTVQIRIGVHSGRVMSGIVGSLRAHYGLFGDAVNTASRMESTGLPMAIQISEATYTQLPQASQAGCSFRGKIEVKGKGLMSTYLVNTKA